MSLLYECIHGIIQGGILDSSEDDAGREEIATLCVSKLRSMIMVDGDPNRKSWKGDDHTLETRMLMINTGS